MEAGERATVLVHGADSARRRRVAGRWAKWDPGRVFYPRVVAAAPEEHRSDGGSGGGARPCGVVGGLAARRGKQRAHGQGVSSGKWPGESGWLGGGRGGVIAGGGDGGGGGGGWVDDDWESYVTMRSSPEKKISRQGSFGLEEEDGEIPFMCAANVKLIEGE